WKESRRRRRNQAPRSYSASAGEKQLERSGLKLDSRRTTKLHGDRRQGVSVEWRPKKVLAPKPSLRSSAGPGNEAEVKWFHSLIESSCRNTCSCGLWTASRCY